MSAPPQCLTCEEYGDDCTCYLVAGRVFEAAREELRAIRRLLPVDGTVTTPALDLMFLDEEVPDASPPTIITGDTGGDRA